MNLGQAVAVCLYELARASPTALVGKKSRAASAGILDRITGELREALRVSGYLRPGINAAADAKVRRLVRRLDVQDEDAEIWLGMLRQILWKLRASEDKN